MTLLILLMWAISIVTNILNPIGMISFCFLLGEGDLDFTLPLIIGGIGFVYGLLTWDLPYLYACCFGQEVSSVYLKCDLAPPSVAE